MPYDLALLAESKRAVVGKDQALESRARREGS